jgi:FtsH-binding integral membrane protein
MENNNWSFNQVQQTDVSQQPVSKTFISGVFSWMGIALAISAVTAYVFGTDMSYMSYLLDTATGKMTGLGYIVMFSPLAFVLLMGFGFNKLSVTALSASFLIYSVLTGMSLSFIFLSFAHSSIYQIFFVTAAMFGTMALVGYTTKTDLTKMGNLLIMALIGMIIAGVVNIFLHSSGLGYIISFISVIVFTGLTAYDVQKLKNIGASVEYAGESTSKIAIMGALTLYLDFINLFISLLRIFGRRD